MVTGRVGAVPHDLLKVKCWKRHVDDGLINKEFSEIKGKYKVPYIGFEGKEEYQVLERVIKGHHSDDSFWERLWSFADSLSTVAGRFRLECDYWHAKDADPFFVRVYGDIKGWSKTERESLHNRIMAILKQYRKEECLKTFEEINELLAEFPADSRFPYVSLKTHHWLTDAIRRNKNFWSECKKNGKKASFEEMYMIRISMPDPTFHKLKKLRGFLKFKDELLGSLGKKLAEWFPLRIGDDVYVVCVSANEVDEVTRILETIKQMPEETGLDIQVLMWKFRKEQKRVGDGGEKSERVYVLTHIEPKIFNIGVYENLEPKPDKSGEYATILEGEYDYVAWIFIMPDGDIEELAEKFLDWGESELKSRYEKSLVEFQDKVREPSPFLSPEIAFSIADGYNKFVNECVEMVGGFEKSVIARSLNKTIIVLGLNKPSEVFWPYVKLIDAKKNLHVPTILSVIVAKPKYPFWRILELPNYANMNCLSFIVGEKMVELKETHAKLIMNVIPLVQRERKRQFYRIVNAACKDDKEVLKIKIEGLASERKLRRETASRLCRLIDEIADNVMKSGGDENSRRQTTCEIFKILRMFTQ